jgi:hypothetical protein
MAYVKIEDVIDHLSSETEKALEKTFSKFSPEVSVSRRTLFREFKRQLYKRTKTWEQVPDRFVKLQ